MAAKAKDKLTPDGEKFYAEIEKLKKLQVRVGFQQGTAQEEDGTDICDVAMWNELGTSSTPSRPFLAMSVDDNADKINAFLKGQLKLLAQGRTTAEGILKAIGVFQKGLIQEKIKSGDFEPNAPSTIAKKGSDKPLIDTGTMRQSVNFAVTKKGGNDK
ncbi:MAG: hypothetical protein E7607_00680 [Ruminococcaceae bacterium]|nr:hypothetical protein [Oscillospiraceae bacterium]